MKRTMAMGTNPHAALKLGGCEYCGEPLNADERTISKRCESCGMLSRTRQHPSIASPGTPLLQGARPSANTTPPAAPAPVTKASPMSTLHLDAELARLRANAVATQATQTHEHRAQRVKEELRSKGVDERTAEQLASRYRPEQLSPDQVDAAILASGGDPFEVRANLLRSGMTPERIEKQLAAMVRR